jgi:hypothetical protein
LTGTKARVAGSRQIRADLEQQLKTCRREIAHAREHLVEAMKRFWDAPMRAAQMTNWLGVQASRVAIRLASGRRHKVPVAMTNQRRLTLNGTRSRGRKPPQ